jgi:hypothetical protein
MLLTGVSGSALCLPGRTPPAYCTASPHEELGNQTIQGAAAAVFCSGWEESVSE